MAFKMVSIHGTNSVCRFLQQELSYCRLPAGSFFVWTNAYVLTMGNEPEILLVCQLDSFSWLSLMHDICLSSNSTQTTSVMQNTVWSCYQFKICPNLAFIGLVIITQNAISNTTPNSGAVVSSVRNIVQWSVAGLAMNWWDTSAVPLYYIVAECYNGRGVIRKKSCPWGKLQLRSTCPKFILTCPDFFLLCAISP